MRTLFIHPTDPSTEFLNIVYNDYLNNDGITVLEGTRISSHSIRAALADADRIVFLGHGTEYGPKHGQHGGNKGYTSSSSGNNAGYGPQGGYGYGYGY